MATPIGHSLAGYAVYCCLASKRKRHAVLPWLCIALANAPDLDFVPGILQGAPVVYHQGVSHSLVFSAVIGASVALIAARIGKWQLSFSEAFVLFFASYASHLLLDFFGPDGRLPYGIPLYWPFSDEHFISPITLFPGTRHASSVSASVTDWIAGVMSIHNLRSVIFESVLIAPFIFLGRWFRRA